MSVRRLIVEVDLAGLNVTEFCRRHGVSTWFFYQLRKRFAVSADEETFGAGHVARPKGVWSQSCRIRVGE